MLVSTKSLSVSVRLESGERVRAGSLVATIAPRIGLRSTFTYSPEYLFHPDAYPLSPTLPLQSSPISAAFTESGLHHVFEDYLPGAWGGLLLKKLGFEPKHGALSVLEQIGDSSLGSLAFGETTAQDSHLGIASISELLQYARHMFSSTAIKITKSDAPKLLQLIQHGGSADGLRPKLFVQFENHDWIAKFDVTQDAYHVARCEMAAMDAAAAAGVIVPNRQLQTLHGKDVYFIERFDVTPVGGRHATRSMLSMMDEVLPECTTDTCYTDLGAVLCEVSTDSQSDAFQLFQRMLVNVVLANRDDHARNFALLRTGSEFRLSPAYDITPNFIGHETHVMYFVDSPAPPSAEHLTKLSEAFGIDSQTFKTMCRNALTSKQAWFHAAENYRVPEREVRELSAWMEKPEQELRRLVQPGKKCKLY